MSRTASRMGHPRVVRSHSAVVQEVWPRLRAALEAPTRSTRRYVVPGRGVRDHQRSAPVSLARGGSRRRRDRHPRPTSSRRESGAPILSATLAEPATGTVSARDRQAGSYRVARHDVMPAVTHDTARYANNRAEASHQPTRQRERQMRGFRLPDHAQRFLHVHGVVQNLSRMGRHRLRAVHHRLLRARSPRGPR